jgi:hypothetical protein
MIKQYFQKSLLFMYPLLNIQGKQSIRPIMTYLDCKSLKGQYLICIYKVDVLNWEKFNKNVLLKHNALKSVIEINDLETAYVFDMSFVKNDYDLIVNGNYSKLSKFTKKSILSFYDISSFEGTQINICLFPEKLNRTKEWCDKPDMEKETYFISERMIDCGEYLKQKA